MFFQHIKGILVKRRLMISIHGDYRGFITILKVFDQIAECIIAQFD